jgi:hypothetical protein
LVEVATWSWKLTATHSDADGQEIANAPTNPRFVAFQVASGAEGSVETKTSPENVTPAQKLVDGQLRESMFQSPV